jgi:hypothetical protein
LPALKEFEKLGRLPQKFFGI